MKRTLTIVGCAAFLLILATPFLFQPKDQDLINQALKESVDASREGRSGSVMEYLSRSLTYNDVPVEYRAQVARYIRNSKPEIYLENTAAIISGDSAQIVTPADLRIAVGPMPVNLHIDRVVITLGRETGTRFVFLPAPIWRIKEVHTDKLDLSGLSELSF
ncbi:MAG: hypothetical protein JST30_03685 [Armatimonadetes bacterium]|nr:hypothetical protein [Armatimonadota bacterium]